jgi:hypothetical protein
VGFFSVFRLVRVLCIYYICAKEEAKEHKGEVEVVASDGGTKSALYGAAKNRRTNAQSGQQQRGGGTLGGGSQRCEA